MCNVIKRRSAGHYLLDAASKRTWTSWMAQSALSTGRNWTGNGKWNGSSF